MGADIHILLERKVDDEWVCVNTFGHIRTASGEFCTPAAKVRNYQRFARLAGVRGDGQDPRGWPEDVSQTARWMDKHWEGDAHSHSWMSAKEAAPIFLETMCMPGATPPKFASQCPAYFFFGIDDEEDEVHRIVFFFDN